MFQYKINKFGGINTRDPIDTLKEYECTDARNVRVDGESMEIRPGATSVSTGLTAAQLVRGLHNVRDTLLCTQNQTVLYFDGSTTWASADITGINATAIPTFISFFGNASSSTTTGTITSVGSNKYNITDSSKAWTENAYVDMFVKITTTNEVRLIVANDATTLYVAEPFDKDPDGLGLTIYASDEVDYFFNGEDTSRYTRDITGTPPTWTNLANVPKFKYAKVYQNRIVGCLKDSSTLYISALLTGEDYPYEIEVGAGDDSVITGIDVLGNQLIIHKGMEGGVWIAEFVDPTQAQFVQRAESYGALNGYTCAVGENMHFFVSDRGIEIFNGLETDMLEGHNAASSYKIPILEGTTYDKDNAKGITFDAKYWVALKHAATPSLANNRVFIFDIGNYLRRYREGRTGNQAYTFLIDSGYEAESFEVLDGVLYMGGNGKVFKHTGTTDDGTAITAYWEKDGITAKEIDRPKALRQLAILTSDGTSSDTIATTVTTDKQTKSLSTITLNNDLEKVSGKRTKGHNFKIKLDISDLGSAKVQGVSMVMEKGKL